MMRDKIPDLIFWAAVIASATMIAYVIVIPVPGERFSEFYALGSGGKAYDYPNHLALGNTGKVTMCTVNHEHKNSEYTTRVLLGNEPLFERNFRLDDGERLCEDITFTPQKEGEHELRLQLHIGDTPTTYRLLRLQVEVR